VKGSQNPLRTLAAIAVSVDVSQHVENMPLVTVGNRHHVVASLPEVAGAIQPPIHAMTARKKRREIVSSFEPKYAS